VIDQEKPTGTEDPATEQMRLLLERAEGGDRSAQPALAMLLDATPEVWRSYGDLARVAQDAWVELVAGPNLLLKESLRRKLAELKSELLPSPAASPLEQLLVERVAPRGCKRPMQTRPRRRRGRSRWTWPTSSSNNGGRNGPRRATWRRSACWPRSASCSRLPTSERPTVASRAGDPAGPRPHPDPL
jgi:hypothetical protein